MEPSREVNGKTEVPPKIDPPMPPKEPEVEATEVSEIKRMRAFEALVNTEGWKHYQALLNYEINQRAAQAFEPVELSDVLALEHRKGTIYSIIRARDVVADNIAAVKEAIDA